jgi:hypothetical protein
MEATNRGVTSPDVDTAYKSTATIAAALASSLLVYVVVAEILARTPAPDPPAFLGTLRIAIFVAAGAAIFMTTILKGIMLRQPPNDPAARIARLRTATIAALALCEFPAVCGLILVLLARARGDFYMLLAISAYMMVRHFPRRGAWREYVSSGPVPGVR